MKKYGPEPPSGSQFPGAAAATAAAAAPIFNAFTAVAPPPVAAPSLFGAFAAAPSGAGFGVPAFGAALPAAAAAPAVSMRQRLTSFYSRYAPEQLQKVR